MHDPKYVISREPWKGSMLRSRRIVGINIILSIRVQVLGLRFWDLGRGVQASTTSSN